MPADRLVDVLWGEDLPAIRPTPCRGISQLRKLVGRDRVVQQGTGYLHDVPDDAVDVHRFEQAVTRGHVALVAGDHGAAVSLGSALELCGRPGVGGVRR